MAPGTFAHAALDLVENMLVVTDVDGTILFVNEAFTRTTGYSLAEAVGATPAILRSGVQDDEFYAAMWARILGGRRWDGEIVNRRRDGTLYTDRMTITPLFDDDGEIRNFVAVKRDVSTHEAALTVGSPSGVAHVDGTGRLVYANPRLEQLLGMSFDELLGHGWARAVDAAADDLRAAIRRAAAGSEQVTTVRLVTGGTARVHLAPLDVGPDGPTGVVAMVEDVTDEVALQRELEERTIQLDRALEHKNALVGMAAHDLRNPISAIQGFAQLLLRHAGDRLSPTETTVLERIEISSRRMVALLNDLVALSDLDQEVRLDATHIDLVGLVEETTALAELIAQDKDVTLVIDAAGPVPCVGDASKLGQVVMNLLTNAIKYSPRGSEVVLSVRGRGDHAELSVRDHGVGIPLAAQRTIFEPFNRDGHRPTEGESSTGLGLAIISRIVEAHRGTISVTSLDGEGSTFTVSIPSRGSPRPDPPVRHQTTVTMTTDTAITTAVRGAPRRQ